jgi:hypothetical protein
MSSPADAIKGAVRSVTKDWAKQRKAEERDRNAAFYRRYRLVRSARTTIREAAFDVMEEAYLAASDGGALPVKPRQIMYAARPKILEMTGELELSGSYFSQTLLVDYMWEHDCSDWDIVWDARGHFIEPHTGTEIPLGTLEVRQYFGERPSFKPHQLDLVFPTSGPENRFGNILFIEKEGFHPLLQAAQLQERYDVAVMSTKGMSVTAARQLIDQLSPLVENIFALHDFDRAGFSIFGTLGTDSRRYLFENVGLEIIDIGLRLVDVVDMDLQSEPVPPVGDYEWRQRADTLKRHGATREEIAFLRDERVELNAMTSRQFIDFIEEKFKEHGVEKVIPDDDVIEKHARRVIKHRLTEQVIAKISDEFTKQAEAVELPEDLREQIEDLLEAEPEVPWDAAVALIIAELDADKDGAA